LSLLLGCSLSLLSLLAPEQPIFEPALEQLFAVQLSFELVRELPVAELLPFGLVVQLHELELPAVRFACAAAQLVPAPLFSCATVLELFCLQQPLERLALCSSYARVQLVFDALCLEHPVLYSSSVKLALWDPFA